MSDSNYTSLVGALFSIVENLTRTVEGIPELKYAMIDRFPDKEMKLVLNHMESAIQIEDINQSKSDKSFLANGFWLLYVVILFGALGLSFIALNIYVYMVQGLGGSALDSTLVQTVFSGGQLFGSPILHAISEKIGRKPVYSFAFIMYIATTVGLMFSSEDYMHDFAIGWLYIMRIIQGFFAII